MAGENVTEITERVGKLVQLASWETERLVDDARQIAEELASSGRSDSALDTQVRKFLNAIRKIQVAVERLPNIEAQRAEIARRIPMLRPRAAYAVSRKPELRPLYMMLEAMVPKVKRLEDFDRLLQFFEAVVAYHKFQQSEQKFGQRTSR